MLSSMLATMHHTFLHAATSSSQSSCLVCFGEASLAMSCRDRETWPFSKASGLNLLRPRPSRCSETSCSWGSDHFARPLAVLRGRLDWELPPLVGFVTSSASPSSTPPAPTSLASTPRRMPGSARAGPVPASVLMTGSSAESGAAEETLLSPCATSSALMLVYSAIGSRSGFALAFFPRVDLAA
jgi:hypothetical protein